MSGPDRRTVVWIEAEAALAADPTIPRAAAYLDGFLDASGREVLREALVQSFLAGRVAELQDRRAAARLELEGRPSSGLPCGWTPQPGPYPRPGWAVRPETVRALRALNRGLLGRLWARVWRAVRRRRAC